LARPLNQIVVGQAVLQRATAAPWRASASLRRPPLQGRCGGGRQGCSPATAVPPLLQGWGDGVES